ncbi:MAG: riboflavin synthase [Betaproteobacteria bacterium]|nr:riboflavin synthase [Betaproteobacteria bacterium]
MFTGIVQAVGRIAELKPAGQAATVTLDAGGLDLGDVAIGDSIACNGVCLTVTRLTRDGFSVDVSHETLRVTAGFTPGAVINLEKSLRLADRLGGHLVSGHVDGIGVVRTVNAVDGNRELTIAFPRELARYFARKGSVTVNGVSLTINALIADSFSINLIPHTLAATNLGELKKDSRVNMEVDLVARYVERMLGREDVR